MDGDAAVDFEGQQVLARSPGDDLQGEAESSEAQSQRPCVSSPPPSTGWYVSAIRRMRGSGTIDRLS